MQGLDRSLLRQFCWQAGLDPVVTRIIAADKIFTQTMFGTLLAKVDTLAADNNFGGNDSATFRAKTLCQSKISVIAMPHTAGIVDSCQDHTLDSKQLITQPK